MTLLYLVAQSSSLMTQPCMSCPFRIRMVIQLMLHNKLQESSDFAISWPSINWMKLNHVKCKEMIINFSKVPGEAIPNVVIENMIVERVLKY